MAWSSGSFSRVRGSASWTNDYNNNTGIEPGLHDTNDQDLAVGINNCLAKDGQNSATGNLDLGGNKLTNVGNATNAQDAVTLSQAQAGINGQSTAYNVNFTSFSNDGEGAYVGYRKSRGTTVGTNTIVQSGDILGSISFWGANGTGYNQAAGILARVDGTPGASNDMPGLLSFRTTADGAGSTTERMRIDSVGNVGIGSTSPQELLHLRSAAPRIRLEDTDAGGAYASISANGTNGNIVLQSDPTNVAAASSIGFDIDGATRAVIDSSGRLGIGTATPSERLHVANGSGSGDLRVLIGEINTLELIRNGSNDAWLRSNIGTLAIDNTNASGTIIFRTNANERLRIDSNGRVQINETSGSLGQLAVTSTNNAFSALFVRSATTGDVAQSGITIRKADNNSTTGQVFIRFEIANTNQGSGQINANGANQAAFGSTSDERLKENIESLPSQYAALMALRPVEFDYIDGSGHQIGFIAQEVQEIYPDLVTENKDGYLMLSGLGKNEARLVKGFQELAQQVSVLTAKVEALEAQLAS